MDNDNKFKPIKDEDPTNESATRARNRTVMLTPDVTGQVRARLQQEMGQGAPDQDFITPSSARPQTPVMRAIVQDEGFVPPATRPTPIVGPSVTVGSGQPIQRPKAPAVQKNPLIGFLVSFDKDPAGEYHELRSGRIIITSDEVGLGNHLVIQDETVSPMHAILRVSPSGEIQVLDQLSEHGTSIRRFGSTEEEQLSGDKSTIDHGDVIKFGKRGFILCIICKPVE